MSKKLGLIVLAATGLVVILPLTPALSQARDDRGAASRTHEALYTPALQMPRGLIPGQAIRHDALQPTLPPNRLVLAKKKVLRTASIQPASSKTQQTTAKKAAKTARPTSRAVAARTSNRGTANVAQARPQRSGAIKSPPHVGKPSPATAGGQAAQKLAVIPNRGRETSEAPALINLSSAERKAAPVTTEQQGAEKAHRVVIQVSQNDPAVMNMVLNNAENLTRHYREKGEGVQVELVAYGPGLHMVRSDTSPVKARLKALTETLKQVSISGCENTMNAHAKQENIDITLVPEARLVSTGIGRITELQEQGWTYIRP